MTASGLDISATASQEKRRAELSHEEETPISAINQLKPVGKPQDHEAERSSIRAGATLDLPYIVMNTLSAIIASYGLLENSPAVVIGAMIVAMLLGPIGGTALALVDGNNKDLAKSVVTLSCGIFIVVITGFIIGLIHSDMPITDQIQSRTSPNLTDLMIALAGGAAGAYATVTPRLSVAFVGVAIATALVPPICAGSLLFARGAFDLGVGAYLLAFTNIVAIQFSFSVVLWLKGCRSVTDIAGLAIGEFLKRHIVSIVALGVLAVMLTKNLQSAVAQQEFKTAVGKALRIAVARSPGSDLADVRIEPGDKSTIIQAVVRGPRQPTISDVAALAAALPAAPHKSKLVLQVRYVQTVTVTPQGILFSDTEPEQAD